MISRLEVMLYISQIGQFVGHNLTVSRHFIRRMLLYHDISYAGCCYITTFFVLNFACFILMVYYSKQSNRKLDEVLVQGPCSHFEFFKQFSRNNKMHYFPLIYFNDKPLHVSGRLAAHHQEDRLSINNNWYSNALC
jgi:hypothetical protein